MSNVIRFHISPLLDNNESTVIFVGSLPSLMAPRKGSSPFSRVESPLQADPDKKLYVLSSKVCGESAAKYFSQNKLPVRFPDDIVRVKRSALRTVDGATFEGKAS